MASNDEDTYKREATKMDAGAVVVQNDEFSSPATVNDSMFNASVMSTNFLTPNASKYFSQAKTAYLVGNNLFNDQLLLTALQSLQIAPVLYDNSSNSSINYDWSSSILIFEEFSGSLFESLRRRISPKIKIYGPSVIKEAAENNERQLPASRTGYPLYCTHLSNCRVSVTGVRNQDHLHEIRRMILYMDGTYVEKEGQVTHLVAAKCAGNKYRDAVALGRPILKPEWVGYLWKNKVKPTFDYNTNMGLYKVKAFYACKIALDGFDTTDETNMAKLIVENGGEHVSVQDPLATHIVKAHAVDKTGLCCVSNASSAVMSRDSAAVTTGEDMRTPIKRPRFDPHVINDLNELEAAITKQKEFPAEKVKVLKAEWFWSSIQIEACADETAYQFDDRRDDFANTTIGTPGSITSPVYNFSDTDSGNTPNSATPGSASRRKRKRARDFVTQQLDNSPFIHDVGDDEKINLGGKSLDQTQDVISDSDFASILKRLSVFLNAADLKTMTTRQIEFVHLIQTERNYVSILMNIVKNFKEPCEQEDQAGGRILESQEVKTIFAPILPIYSLHRRILRDLFHLQETWNEENLIGNIYVKYAQELRKSYEPFINFFESIKNEIARCESEKPRFLAFLRIAQGKPECGKQTLADLMIRPVQRLPSTALILVNLSKHTSPTNPDADWISRGLEAINQVNQTINEEKKRTDARIAMFDIFHEIDGCPVELLSDHRSLLYKLDVTSLTDIWGQKHDPLTLCVFSDHIQITKRKGSAVNKNLSAAASVANLRSPNVSRKSSIHGPSLSISHQKRYKFLEWVSFVNIRKVVDVTDMPTAFAFIVRAPNEFKERHMVFTIPDDPSWTKASTVTFFAKQVANAVDRVDYEYVIARADTTFLNVSENFSVLEKAARFATKTSKKVGRALSLTRTPSKLKRTMSQIMSPFSGKSQQDPDTISQTSSEVSTTPLRNNLSTMSLWFGSKRGTMEGATPRTRRALIDKEARKNIPCIQEM